MNDKTVETIKATMHDMNHAESGSVRMASIAQFKYNAEAWCEYLLAEHDKLQAVADAARECADMLVFPEGERTFGQVAQRAMLARDRLREALAKLDGEG